MEEHTCEFVPYVTEPTCTEPGYTTWVCPCGQQYTSDYVEAKGHTEEAMAELPPTCTEIGFTAGVVCSVCGQVLEGCDEIAASGHVWMEVEEIPPQVGKTGLTAGTVCSVCGECLFGCEEIPALEEEPILSIEAQPEDAAPVDGVAAFSVRVSVNGAEEVAYQWQRLDESIAYETRQEREDAWQDIVGRPPIPCASRAWMMKRCWPMRPGMPIAV